ncbi:DNA-binding transcriptional regulator, LysR family [Alteromonadaceae bacterium Bs31]|nr:DNA-binding transcriptional regulator, LysR family [Alteromonadaceae bacterium Bs31]
MNEGHYSEGGPARISSTNAYLLCKIAQMNNWDDLRYFLQLARNGSLSAAARALGVNHSTIARRIGAFEKTHGIKLFTRHPEGYRLSDAGEEIYARALTIEAENHAVERLLYAGDTRLSGKLVATMPHDLANFCIIPHLQVFTEQYPDVDLELVVSPGLKNLSAREADMAIRLTPAPPDNLVGVELAKLRHGVYFSDEASFHSKQPNLIIWRHETQLPDWATEHFPESNVVLRVDDLASMYAAVKAGLGIARMPCYLPDVLKDSHIYRTPISLTPSTWGVWVLHHADLRETARVRAFKKFLSATITEQKSLIEGEMSCLKKLD